MATTRLAPDFKEFLQLLGSAKIARRERVEVDGVFVDIISLADLKANKRASGRLQDLDDVDKLP